MIQSRGRTIHIEEQSLEKNILIDTGMDLICSSCVEWKSVTSCAPIDKISTDKAMKYLIESDLTRNIDGNYYVCSTCKSSIDNDKEPRRAQKEILGFLNFPIELKELLEVQCTPRNKYDRHHPNKPYIELNRLEDYLLKPVIPFIRTSFRLALRANLSYPNRTLQMDKLGYLNRTLKFLSLNI